MKKILMLLVILMFVGCITLPKYEDRPYYDPLGEVKVEPTESKYRIITIINYESLAITIYTKEGLTECGLSDDEFKKYVFKKIEGTNYLYEPMWDWRKTLTGEDCIARAFVYYEKK